MDYEQEKEIMQMFIDSAKTYIQLGTATLGLSVTFIEKILGKTGPVRMDGMLVTAWGLLLISIACAALYQYLAVKYLDAKSQAAGAKGAAPEYLIANPGVIYGVMMVTFIVGVFFLLIEAIWMRINVGCI